MRDLQSAPSCRAVSLGQWPVCGQSYVRTHLSSDLSRAHFGSAIVESAARVAERLVDPVH